MNGPREVVLKQQTDWQEYTVEFLSKQPTVKAPAETFTGDAWVDVIARGEEPSRMRVNVVRFAPGARARPGSGTS